MKKILQDLSFAETEEKVLSLGEKKFRAKQLFEGLMQGRRISDITSLSGAFKARLLEEYEDEPVRIKETFYSSDGTEKYLFSLSDGNLVEGVLMKYKYGYTQCISTQVGCRMGCKFCASTLGDSSATSPRGKFSLRFSSSTPCIEGRQRAAAQ